MKARHVLPALSLLPALLLAALSPGARAAEARDSGGTFPPATRATLP